MIISAIRAFGLAQSLTSRCCKAVGAQIWPGPLPPLTCAGILLNFWGDILAPRKWPSLSFWEITGPSPGECVCNYWVLLYICKQLIPTYVYLPKSTRWFIVTTKETGLMSVISISQSGLAERSTRTSLLSQVPQWLGAPRRDFPDLTMGNRRLYPSSPGSQSASLQETIWGGTCWKNDGRTEWSFSCAVGPGSAMGLHLPAH